MTLFSDTDTSYFEPEVLSAKLVEMTDEELRIYKLKVSFENEK